MSRSRRWPGGAPGLGLTASLALVATGCPPRVKPEPYKTPILQPVPPPGTPVVAVAAPAAGALPLPPEGHNSEAQLAAEAALLADPAERAAFEDAFRLTFTTERGRRDAGRARGLLAPLVARNFAPAWRVQGYGFVDQGFQVAPAIECYEKAVAADEAYGPGHYALAFMLGQTDPARGRVHFERALALGVADARNLRQQFYR